MVGDFDEGDAAIHTVVFAIEDHFAVDVLEAFAGGGKSEGELFGLEKARMVNRHPLRRCSGRSYTSFRGAKSDRGVIFDVEEFFALQFAVLHSRFRCRQNFASMVRSRTPVVTSGDVDASVDFHLSNFSRRARPRLSRKT